VYVCVWVYGCIGRPVQCTGVYGYMGVGSGCRWGCVALTRARACVQVACVGEVGVCVYVCV